MSVSARTTSGDDGVELTTKEETWGGHNDTSLVVLVGGPLVPELPAQTEPVFRERYTLTL